MIYSDLAQPRQHPAERRFTPPATLITITTVTTTPNFRLSRANSSKAPPHTPHTHSKSSPDYNQITRYRSPSPSSSSRYRPSPHSITTVNATRLREITRDYPRSPEITYDACLFVHWRVCVCLESAWRVLESAWRVLESAW